jgi:tripartite-type tricarboxylate transporter receptor subunit TctC
MHMKPGHLVPCLRAAIAAILTLGCIAASAQGYPDRPIRLVVPFAPGGGADLIARAIATPLGRRLKQPVIVDNRPGAGGTLGADLVAKAPADGYTMLYTTPGPQFTNPFLMARLPYDPVRDLAPVSELAVVPSVLVVNKSVPATSLKELIQYARANPGKLTFASAGIGSSSHLAGELLKYTAKVDMVHVPYRGTGPALQDLLGGQVSMAIDSVAVYQPHIENGTVRAIAVSSADRVPSLPNVPSIADDFPGFEGSPINYLTVRSGTPPEIIRRLSAEVNAVLASPETRKTLLANGVLPKGSTPEQLGAIVNRETAKWKNVIEVSGAKVD